MVQRRISPLSFKISLIALSFGAHAYAATPSKSAIHESENAYFSAAQEELAKRKAIKINNRRAKNVILFIADGMGPTTVAAARIYDGQTRGEDGEENHLSFEKFPYLAMAKTYTTDAQTPDSAGTMSAMITGVKTKSGVLSVSDAAIRGQCEGSAATHVATAGELAEAKGLATGIISTARITHATPAGVYSHTPARGWESDADLSEEAQKNGCKDIASQLIDFPYGDGIDVVMGGGRRAFLPADYVDPDDKRAKGRRRDGRNLVAEWKAKTNGSVAFDDAGFDSVITQDTTKFLGLFDQSHMDYEADRKSGIEGEPSLAEMTEKSIEILSKDPDGFFLVVEAGRVDHAHHGGNAARALRDAQAFSNAVAIAREMTSSKDTLIIATADHGHTLTFQGYPAKGNNILGLANSPYDDAKVDDDGNVLARDEKPYTTLIYGNGPGSVFVGDQKDGRQALTAEEVADLSYRQQALIPSGSESHGGQDVTIYADGPKAHLFGGVVEQNYIYHVIDEALALRK